MSALTKNQQVRYAAGSDAPDLTVISRNLAEDLERLGVMRFEAAKERTDAIPNPVEGMLTWLPGGYQRFVKGAWRPFPERPGRSRQKDVPSFSTTATWNDFSDDKWPAASLVVPPSGEFTVTVSAAVANSNTDLSRTGCGYRLSGGLTVACTDESAVVGVKYTSASKTRWFDGATPGSVVTATPQWVITSGGPSTATCLFGQLLMEGVS